MKWSKMGRLEHDDGQPKSIIVKVSVALVALVAINLAACATGGGTRRETADPMQDAVFQPFKDLGLMRDAAPDVLVRATAAPYAIDASADCAALTASIAQLDDILGPDVDAMESDGDSVGLEIVSGAVRSALGLPFRGVIRRISGAEARERFRARAVLAGMVRRGYLKGLAHAAACP